MGRLLWKELHEIKWYLIGLLFGPWILTLWPSSTLGYRIDSHYNDWDVHILLLILTFWAATRMPGEMRPNRLTVRSLPISPWRVWAVKFLPGLIMVILLPLWIHLVAEIRVHPDYDRWQWHTPLKYITDNFARAASLYTVTFAASLFASSIAAVLAGWFAVFGCIIGGAGYTGYPIEESYTHGTLAVVGVFVILGIWTKARSGGIRRKAVVAAISAALVPLVGLAALFSYSAIITGDPRLAWTVYGRELLTLRPGYVTAKPDRIVNYLREFPSHIVSPDRRCIAYTTIHEDPQPRAVYRGGMVVSRPSHRTVYLLIFDSLAGTVVLRQKDAAPAAWLPDGNLLFVTCNSKKETMDLLEWDRVSRGVSKLASFPRSADQSYSPAIQLVIPSGDGTNVALFVNPRRGWATDLWVLDRKSHALKLLQPNLTIAERDGVEAAWDGDRLVFGRYWTYWSIRSDGSNLRRTFEPRMGAKDD